MWTDTVSPVAFAPPPAVPFRAGGSSVPKRLPLEEIKRHVKFVHAERIWARAFTANVDLVLLLGAELEEAPSSHAAAELVARISF